MTFADDRIGFRWHEGTRCWQVFGLLPDCRFYGEYIDNGNRVGFKNLFGTVSPADYQRIMSLAVKIKSLPPRAESEPRGRVYNGHLFEGSRADAHILFVRFEDLPSPIHDELFAEIVEIMKKYCAHLVDG